MKWLLCAGGLFLLCSCAPPSPYATWNDYHISRHALRVTTDRADILGCEELGAVSGRSYDDAGSAKEKAISDAVLLGANYLFIDDIETDLNERDAYFVGSMNVIYVYGTAYKCGN